jgi:hypothetical protein
MVIKKKLIFSRKYLILLTNHYILDHQSFKITSFFLFIIILDKGENFSFYAKKRNLQQKKTNNQIVTKNFHPLNITI